jgi:predicted lipoprotein with Yx(FWY)xxD motif
MNTRWTCGTAIAAVAITIGACGGTDERAAVAAGDATVSVAHVDRVGAVLVNRDGATLYTPDQESDGKVSCKGECLSIWLPLTASGTPTAADGVDGKLGTIDRPDGTMQVTIDGKPLYTFAEDLQAGQVNGNGVKDRFGAGSFTWHAVTADGSSAGGGGGFSY